MSALRRNGWRIALLLPSLLALAALVIVPVGRLLIDSLLAPTPSVDHYAALVTDAPVLGSFVVTLALSIATTVVALIIGFPLAYLLASLSGRAATLLSVFVLLPFWTTSVVTTFAFLVLLGRQGLVNQSLQAIGLTHQPIPLLFNAFSVVAGLVHIGLPLMVLSVYASIRQVDVSLLRAAETLGASPGRAIVEVLVPLAMPGIATGSILVFVTTIGAYVIPSLLGGQSENMVAQYVIYEIQKLNDVPQAGAMTVGLLGVTFLTLAVANRTIGIRQVWNPRGRLG